MYSEEDLAGAVRAGVLTEENAKAFRAYVERSKSTSAVDEEHFRLVTGFNDIFVTIACCLLLVSVKWLGEAVAEWLGMLALSAVAWGLGEYFIRKRRMALPAIVLLLAFVGGILFATMSALSPNTTTTAIAAAVAAVAAWLHWLRFHVPITVAAGVGALVGCIVAAFVSATTQAEHWIRVISFFAGIGVFVLAMWWDGADTRRETRKSDVAFWLHLLAAPLLVHPVFATLGVLDGRTTWAEALAVVALYIAIALVSLSIDRRALMVSALVYVLYAFSALFQQYGVVSLNFAIAALVIGSALLLLSAFWHTSRAFALGFLPPRMKTRLAPLR